MFLNSQKNHRYQNDKTNQNNIEKKRKKRENLLYQRRDRDKIPRVNFMAWIEEEEGKGEVVVALPPSIIIPR